MNKIKLTIILTLFAALCTTAYGQVTIGSNNPPNNGALLDLKEKDPKPEDAGGVTTSKGLGLPRVNLTNLKPAVPTGANSLPVSIGSSDTETWDLSTHIGLTVYNVKASDQCASDPIPTGVFTWMGTKWKYLGENPFDVLASGVREFTDPRDGEKYLYSNFGSDVGDWMLENLRYIPNPADGYPDYSESLGALKYYAFPSPNGTHSSAAAKTDWESG